MFVAWTQIGKKEGVFINGQFDDWKGALKYTDPSNDVSQSNINIIKVGAIRDSKYMSFYVMVQGQMMSGPSQGLDSLTIFIDGDNNPSTGYRVENLGADYMLRVDGYNGNVNAKNFWKFDDSRDTNDFNGFHQSLRVAAANDANELEAQITLADTEFDKGTVVSCLAVMEDAQGNSDRSLVFSDKAGALVATLTWAATSLSVGTNTVGTVRLEAFGSTTQVQKLVLDIRGSISPNAISSITVGTASTTPSDSRVTFTLSPALEIVKDSSETLSIGAALSAGGGSTMGLKFADVNPVTADARNIRVVQKVGDTAYIGNPLPDIRIDGAFDDWEGRTTITDGLNDVEEERNVNVDITEVKYDTDTDDIFFYLKVSGTVLMGADVPRQNVRPGPPGEPGEPVTPPPPPVLPGEDKAYV
jgi:hypothetical protein